MKIEKMREIKFRFWTESDKTFERDYALLWNPFKNEMVFIDGDDNHYTTDDGIVCQQFTGIRDRNGKEIYEGDIIQEFFPIAELTPEKCKREVVRWVSTADGYDMDGFLVDTIGLSDGCNEVIGNIFENPELIKEG